MFKTKIKYQSEIVFSVLIMLIYFLIFNLGGKKVLAAENGKVNLEAWSLTDTKKQNGDPTTTQSEVYEATLSYSNATESNFKNIVIPNAADFRSAYPKLEKVWIYKTTMRSALSNANKSGGSLKISDTEIDDENISTDVKEKTEKVFAKGGDWSELSNVGSWKYVSLIESIDLSRFDTSNVTDMSYMFYNCSGLTSLDLSDFDTSNVINMSYMFSGCSGLTSLDLSGLDTRQVTQMNRMFYNCNNLTSLDLSSFDTGEVLDMFAMFKQCGSLEKLDLGDEFDTSKVNNMSEMFYECGSLSELNLGNNFDFSGLGGQSGCSRMFQGCRISNSDAFMNIKNMKHKGYMYGMYADCMCGGDLYLNKLAYDGNTIDDYTIGPHMPEYDSHKGMFTNANNLLYLDLSSFNMDRFIDSGLGTTISAKNVFTAADEPLLITNDSDYLKNYNYEGDHRTLFTTTLKVDGENVKFKGGDEGKFVKYNDDKTEKYINIYETYTTTDTKEEILQKLEDRLEEEKKNLIVANGGKNLEWRVVGDTEGKVSYSLQGVYVMFVDGVSSIQENESENKDGNSYYRSYSWETVENSGGNSGGGNFTTSQGQNLISNQDQSLILNNESKHEETLPQTESKIPEKLRTGKYLFGYPDGKMKPENYVTNAEFATIIYRLINNGEKINYDKLKDIGVERSDWFADAVAYLMDDSRKIINVTDEKFNPNKNITGYEMLNIIHNVLKFYDADKNLTDNQNLNLNITRAEMAKIIFNAFDRKNNLGQKIYPDLDKNHWAYKFLMDASE